ncbi:MAG: response regulator transcription factor [Actinomycetes bacterium]
MGHILLADDDPDIRELVTLKLELSGHTVTAVVDGLSAWAALQQGAYDLLLLDVMMPGLSGEEVCRLLRASEPLAPVGGSRPRLPVLLLTAHAAVNDADLAASGLDVDGVVSKPFSPRELAARVDAVLAARD